jgi:hypothetical protein
MIAVSGCAATGSFGLNEQRIAGDYSLQRWEDFRTYYLEDSERDYESFPDPGPVGGTVVRIGWNEAFIVVERKAHFYGRIDGWMIIDVQEKIIRGPVPFAAIEADRRLRNIRVLTADEAWALLEKRD